MVIELTLYNSVAASRYCMACKILGNAAAPKIECSHPGRLFWAVFVLSLSCRKNSSLRRADSWRIQHERLGLMYRPPSRLHSSALSYMSKV